jgi:hypothetical protein
MSLLAALVGGTVLLPDDASTQVLVRLRGVAYDSVASRPLAGAMITLDAVRTAFADESGVFAFDSVAPGPALIEMTHAVLDSMGLPGVARRIQVPAGDMAVTLAVPSFATLWRAACGDRQAPSDSGFVYGTVRSATDGAAVPGTDVELSWSDIRVQNIRSISGRRIRVETASDGNGEYSVCGVPLDEGMRLQARRSATASAALDLIPAGLRVVRRDLLLGPSDTTDARARGSIVGRVMREEGGPFVGATIVVDDASAGRSGADGRFTVAGVVAGTHQVEVLGIGAKPQLFAVDVIAGREVEVSAVLSRVTRLDEVRIVASPWQMRVVEGIEERKTKGFAHVFDSTFVNSRTSVGSAVQGLNGVNVQFGRGSNQYTITMRSPSGRPCTPLVRIDGYIADMERLQLIHPAEIAVLETYPRAASIPMELQQGVSACGMIVVWTKHVMP